MTGLFHGTCAANWSRGSGDPLYLARQPESARGYAQEWEACGEQPILLRFDLAALLAAGLTLEPNWETVEQLKRLESSRAMLTWQESLEQYGSLCIPNFPENEKRLATQIPLL